MCFNLPTKMERINKLNFYNHQFELELIFTSFVIALKDVTQLIKSNKVFRKYRLYKTANISNKSMNKESIN